jgi:hypothetical protein
MASNPGERAASERQPSLPGEQPGDRVAHEDRRERCGTVVLSRAVKDDGRALILYSHAGEEST